MLVSCVMPTRSRPAFAAEALNCYLSQTYQDRELIILDDADSPSFPDGVELDGVLYGRMANRLVIGAKRNVAVSRSHGELVCHWDDDDYSAPGRIADQVARLGSYQITGYHSMRFTDGVKWWQFSGSSEDYALGTSLLYRREYWEANPFQSERSCGEDMHFIHPARCSGRIICADAGDMMHARNHSQNTDERKDLNNTECLQWREIACG